MTPQEAYLRYHEFVRSSDVINRLLFTCPEIRDRLGESFVHRAQRFNHLLMFLCQFMAFEGFVNALLLDTGLKVKEIAAMGSDIEQKLRRIAPDTVRAPRWRDELIPQLEAEMQLRHAWMHGCGDDSRVKSDKKRKRIPMSVLDHDPLSGQDWVSPAVWSESAGLICQLVEAIATERKIR